MTINEILKHHENLIEERIECALNGLITKGETMEQVRSSLLEVLLKTVNKETTEG